MWRMAGCSFIPNLGVKAMRSVTVETTVENQGSASQLHRLLQSLLTGRDAKSAQTKEEPLAAGKRTGDGQTKDNGQ